MYGTWLLCSLFYIILRKTKDCFIEVFREMDTGASKATLSEMVCFCLHCRKGFTLKEKKLLRRRPKGAQFIRKKTGSDQSYFPGKKICKMY